MGYPFLGEIRITPYNYAPEGWLFCDGSVLQISAYQSLAQLIGNTYGGDGQNTFALPDLRSRVPLHMGTASGNTYTLSQTGGLESVGINFQQLPNHPHSFAASASDPNQNGPGGNYPSNATNTPYTTDASNPTPMGTNPVGITGGNQPHNNIMPFLGIAFIIAYEGQYPSQN